MSHEQGWPPAGGADRTSGPGRYPSPGGPGTYGASGVPSPFGSAAAYGVPDPVDDPDPYGRSVGGSAAGGYGTPPAPVHPVYGTPPAPQGPAGYPAGGYGPAPVDAPDGGAPVSPYGSGYGAGYGAGDGAAYQSPYGAPPSGLDPSLDARGAAAVQRIRRLRSWSTVWLVVGWLLAAVCLVFTIAAVAVLVDVMGERLSGPELAGNFIGLLLVGALPWAVPVPLLRLARRQRREARTIEESLMSKWTGRWPR